MAAELARGAATLGAQGASNAQLRRAGEEFAGQRTALRKGKRSLSTLTRAAAADRLVLWLGSALFALVVLHITFKRVPLLTPLHPAVLLRWGAKGAVQPQNLQAISREHVSSPPPPPPPPPPPAASLEVDDVSRGGASVPGKSTEGGDERTSAVDSAAAHSEL
jgi:hypothetical protein